MDFNECRNSNIWLASYNQKKYGFHRLRVLDKNLDNVRICVYCGRRRPVSLEELAVLVLVRNIELLKNADFAQSHHPQRIYWIIGRAINANLRFKASEFAEFIPKDSEPNLALFDVEPDKEIILKRFLFYCSVYHKLRAHMENPSDLIKKIVEYLENFDNDYSDFWHVMRSAMQSAEFNYQDTMTKSDGRNIIDIYVKIPELVDGFYEPGEDFEEQEYAAMKELLQMQKRSFACPVVFKTRAIMDLTSLPQDITSLLQNVDPQWISYVALTASSPWSVAYIEELGRVLSACENLNFIYLRQLPNTETPEDMAAAVSRLLGHHSQLEELELGGFPLGEMMERYPLPHVAKLGLYDCGLTDADWKSMASRSDFSLSELAVSSTLPSPPSSSLYDFILKHETSLESLSLKYFALIPDEICDLMTSIAKFNTLQHLHVSYNHLDLVSMLNILLTFMAIDSAEDLEFESPDEMPEIEQLYIYLVMEMKTFCELNRRLPICLALMDDSTMELTPWDN